MGLVILIWPHESSFQIKHVLTPSAVFYISDFLYSLIHVICCCSVNVVAVLFLWEDSHHRCKYPSYFVFLCFMRVSVAVVAVCVQKFTQQKFVFVCVIMRWSPYLVSWDFGASSAFCASSRLDLFVCTETVFAFAGTHLRFMMLLYHSIREKRSDSCTSFGEQSWGIFCLNLFLLAFTMSAFHFL